MTTRRKIAITLVSAVALGVTDYGSTLSVGAPGPGRDLWGWSVLAADLLAIVGVFFVDRWWALLPALVPTAVGIYIYNLTDFVYPWESIGPSSGLGIYALFLLLAIAFEAAMLAVGLLTRRLWEQVRRRRNIRLRSLQ